MKKKTTALFLLLIALAALCCFGAAAQDSIPYAVLCRGEDGWETCIVTVDSIPPQTLTDGPVQPPLTVLKDNVPLSEALDYSVSYFDNDLPGEATARVLFRGDFWGYIDIAFEIRPFEVSVPEIAPIPDQVYSGEPITPEPVVFVGTQCLTCGEAYAVYYENNVDVGTAQVLVEVFGEESQFLSAEFQILPRDAATLAHNELSAQPYTGLPADPELCFTFGDVTLTQGEDYTLEYFDDVEPGTATVTAAFFGNYTGTLSLNYQILFGEDLVLEGEAASDGVFLSWNAPYGTTSFRLYRFEEETGAYALLSHTKATFYQDRKCAELTEYRYKLVCYSRVNGALVRSPIRTVCVTTGLRRPNLALKTMNKKIKVVWTENPNVTGYLLYRYDASTGKERKIAKIKDPSIRKYLDKNVKNGVSYNYTVRSYKKVDGVNVFSEYSEGVCSTSPKSLLAGVKKQKLTSYPIYNVQGKSTRYLSSVELSAEDLKILEDFAQTHFKRSWTDEQKLKYTLEWINAEIYYPFGKTFEKICQVSHTVAIFKYKKGQCLQYNGAMCAMMTYLGYPSRLIMGYRGTWGGERWQHFWAESVLNETTYVLETGNYGRSGDWMYFFKPYSETFGYIKNQANVS